MATRLKSSAEARAKKPGEGMDINQLHIARVIGAVSMGESDVKLEESVFEFIDSTWR